jgi:hypothetical protein
MKKEKGNPDTENGLDRRKFISRSVLATAAIPSLSFGNIESSHSIEKDGKFVEPRNKIPVKKNVDVLVCGGGPAGIGAAITAARAGAKVQLIELNGCLGGVWTAGLLTWIFDIDKPGIARELTDKLEERKARSKYKENGVDSQYVYVPEEMKVLLEEMCLESGVSFRLHTRVVAAYKKGKQLTTVITESKSGREAWQAKVFIDATGDGDLGAFAGNGWDIGMGGETCPCQPMTLNALAVVRDANAIRDYISMYEYLDETGETQYGIHHRPASERLMKEIQRAGITPSYGRPTIFQIKENLVLLMLNHEYSVEAYDADKVTEATVRARMEIHDIVNGLNSLGGVWAGLQVASSAEHIGIRDGRRIHGRYTVTKNDLMYGTEHDDTVVKPTFNVDIHAVERKINDTKGPIFNNDFEMKPYGIPLRALIARDVDGLMMAGRCISGDFVAHASYRVTGNAVALGEAAGVVAAIAASSNRLPHQVEWAEGAEKLKKMGQH